MDWRIAYGTRGSLVFREPGAGLSRKSLVVYAVLAFLLPLAARLAEFPLWDASRMAGGRHLLVSPEAYAYLAEALTEGRIAFPASLLRGLSRLPGLDPGEAAFWIPLLGGAFLSVTIFFWAAAFGAPNAGIVAGICASLSPGVLMPTMLGSYGPHVFIVPLVFLVPLAPLCWLRSWLSSPLVPLYGFIQCGAETVRSFVRIRGGMPARCPAAQYSPQTKRFAFKASPPSASGAVARDGLSFSWLFFLAVTGMASHLAAALSPLLFVAVLLTALLTPFLIAAFGPSGGRCRLLGGALCHSLPLVGGWPGAAGALALAYVLGAASRADSGLDAPDPVAMTAGKLRALCCSPVVLAAAWSGVGYLAYTLFAGVTGGAFAAFTESVPAGDLFSFIQPDVPEPSAKGSIAALTGLLHPYGFVAPLAVAGTLVMFAVYPASLYAALPLFLGLYAPFAAHLPSGAMLAAPVLMLGLALGGSRCVADLTALVRLRLEHDEENAGFRWPLEMRSVFWQRLYRVLDLTGLDRVASLARVFPAVVLAFVFVRPVMERFPEYIRPTFVSRDMAEAFLFIRDHGEDEALAWIWRTWGDAARHYSGKRVISDSRRDSGLHAYLPALVYATPDFSMAHTIVCMGERPQAAGEILSDLVGLNDDNTARTLLDAAAPGGIPDRLRKPSYIVVSLDMVPLIPEITRIGGWDFAGRRGEGAIVRGPFDELPGNMETGVFFLRDNLIAARTADIFNADGLQRHRYYRLGGDRHYVVDARENATRAYELRPRAYATLLYQFLVIDPDDAALEPYFRLVFSNGTARVFEVL